MPPQKLLLVFIHGFQGSQDTFGNFPRDVCNLLSHRLPHFSVQFLVFPTFETRGNLNLAVDKFRSWLEEQVIDLEVGLGTPSPTVDPGVAVVICGHSMGGIVGAEAVGRIAGERVLEGSMVDDNDNDDGSGQDDGKGRKTGLFPLVQGLLAFDTPYLGIDPGVFSHGAQGHWEAGKQWYDVAQGAFATAAAAVTAKKATDPSPAPADAKPLPPTPSEANGQNQKSASSSWASSWGRTALLTSAGIAATAGLGTAAFLSRKQITSGFGWVTSHLEFVDGLARASDLSRRLETTVAISEERKLGFANLYTILSPEKGGKYPGRTFCNLPTDAKGKTRAAFREARNDKAGDEIAAHIGMFIPQDNPGYYAMSEQALELIVSWVDKDSY